MRLMIDLRRFFKNIFISVFTCIIPVTLYAYTPILLARWSQDVTNSSKVTPIEVWMSSDGGVSWEIRGIPDSARTQGDMGLALGVSRTGNLYLTAICDNSIDFFYGARFYVSPDTGKTWEYRSNLAYISAYDKNSAGIAVLNDTLIYVYLLGANSTSLIEVFKSVDGGYNWSTTSFIPVPTIDNDVEGEMCYDYGNRLYLTDWCSQNSFPFCYRSLDGTSWVMADTISLDNSNIEGRSTAITCIGDSLYATVWSNTCELKLYKSITQGTNWSFLATILDTCALRDGSQAIGIAKDNIFYVAAWDNTRNTAIFRSDDMGVSWVRVGNIPPVSNRWACSLSFSPLELPAFSCEEQKAVKDISTKLRITKNENSYIFYYNLPSTQFVAIRIYDLAGRLKSCVFSGIKNKGEHIATWPFCASSGIYIYQIKTGKQAQTGKLVILK